MSLSRKQWKHTQVIFTVALVKRALHIDLKLCWT